MEINRLDPTADNTHWEGKQSQAGFFFRRIPVEFLSVPGNPFPNRIFETRIRQMPEFLKRIRSIST
jgi:hypothetical protein